MITKSFLVRVGADTRDMERGLKTAETRMKKFSEQCSKIGRGMMIGGAAIIGALTMITKKASDAQETFSKFGTVFQDVTAEANASLKDLTKNYGLSKLAAAEMLSATGDLLTGLGMQGEIALSLSRRTQKLSVDLASFTNFSGGAKGASEALTKAMLGERESVKSLGIVITEEMVKEHLLKEGKEKLTGMALLQAKAEATLAIAITQSKNAIGDYERTSGSLANVVRLLVGRLEDLWVIIGTKLIPVATKYADKITEIVEKTVAWTEAQPKLTAALTIGGAALGGALLSLGAIGMVLPKVIIGLKLVKVAAVGLGPVFWSIAAGAAAAYGAIKLLEKLRPGAVLDEQTKAYKKITEVIGFWSDFEDAAVRAGVARREDLIAIWDKYEQNTQQTLVAIATGTEGKALEEFLRKLTRGHSDALAGAVKHGEGLKDAIEKPAEAIAKTGPVFTSWATAVAKIFHDVSVRAAEMRAAMKDIKLILPPVAITMPKFTLETEIGTEEFETFGEWFKAWAEGLLEKWQAAWQAALSGARDVLGALSGVFSQFHENEAMRIDNEERKKTEALDNWYEQEKAKIEATITDEEDLAEALAALEEKKAEKQAALQEKIEKQRRKLERKRAKAQKAGGLFAAGINMAEAITKAFTAGPIIGKILAIATAALCGIQIAAIASAPLPSLAKGGMIEKEGIYRLHPGEEVRSAAAVKAQIGPSTFSPTVNIYTKYLDDRTIDQAAEKIFARLQMEKERYT